MDTNKYFDNKIVKSLRECTRFMEIMGMLNLINDCFSLTDIEKCDLKLELLIAGRQYKDDSDENKAKLDSRLRKIDFELRNANTLNSVLQPNSPSEIESQYSDVYDEIEIDETLGDRTLTAKDIIDACETESTGEQSTYTLLCISIDIIVHISESESERRDQSTYMFPDIPDPHTRRSPSLFSDTSNVSPRRDPNISEDLFSRYDTSTVSPRRDLYLSHDLFPIDTSIRSISASPEAVRKRTKRK